METIKTFADVYTGKGYKSVKATIRVENGRVCFKTQDYYYDNEESAHRLPSRRKLLIQKNPKPGLGFRFKVGDLPIMIAAFKKAQKTAVWLKGYNEEHNRGGTHENLNWAKTNGEICWTLVKKKYPRMVEVFDTDSRAGKVPSVQLLIYLNVCHGDGETVYIGISRFPEDEQDSRWRHWGLLNRININIKHLPKFINALQRAQKYLEGMQEGKT